MEVLSRGQARRIASEWHGGQTSALYELCSAGHISDDTLSEIDREIGEVERRPGLVDDPAQALIDLRALRSYVQACRGRSFVGVSWHAVWDDTPATVADAGPRGAAGSGRRAGGAPT
ncbi:MAG: hypothetical protein ACRDXB_17565 [Actinomycetes bacterium]